MLSNCGAGEDSSESLRQPPPPPRCFSHVQLCATPWTAAYQASLSMGFSRQEHWSGLPFPSPTLTTNEMQIKITMSYHLISVRMTIIKKTRDSKHCEGSRDERILSTVGGNVNWFSHYGKQYGNSSKKITYRNDIRPSNPNSGYICNENENRIFKRY